MEPERLIVGSLLSVVALLLGVYVSFTIRGKGPIFSNAYFWKNRDDIDKKAEYRLVSAVFGCLTAVFFFMALYTFTLWRWFYAGVWLSILSAVIIAVVSAVKREKK